MEGLYMVNPYGFYKPAKEQNLTPAEVELHIEQVRKELSHVTALLSRGSNPLNKKYCQNSLIAENKISAAQAGMEPEQNTPTF